MATVKDGSSVKRSVLLGARMRFSPTGANIREEAIQRILEQNLAATETKRGLTEGELRHVLELGGNMPYGFHMNNSPAQISRETDDVDRPIILVSSSGTQLLLNARESKGTYIACFRNLSAISSYLAGRHDRVAILGAGTRGQFRREDQMGCAWVAERLIQAGYRAEDPQTSEYVAKWKGVSPEEVRGGRSAEYLRKSGQEQDLEFILGHIDDLETVPALINGELVAK